MLVRTRAPSATTEGEVNVGLTSFGNGHGSSVDGFLGGALGNSDRLFGSVAFMASDEDSHLKNLTPFNEVKGKVKETYLQGKLRWEPTDT
ncbi:TonB-dependent receptor, partial [Mycobacterium tuberculosis]